MAKGSHPPTFKAYGVRRECYSCGEKLGAKDSAWFRGYPSPAVFCFKPACRKAAARCQ